MTGFIPNIINLITDNLRDRYDNGFPVLKELIQNADDAQAKCFRFGHHAGFADETSHPLLAGPALWFFNDGNFKPEDKKAIRSFGVNSKAGNTATIGKFGLGMKSVFHLAEAFLYAGMTDSGEKIHDLINPWDNGDANYPHSDWGTDIPEHEWCILQTYAREQMAGEKERGFLLWLPLRTKALLDGKGAIIDSCAGDPESHELGFLENPDLPKRLAAVLAMLPHLERITYSHPENGFDLRLKAGKSRLSLGRPGDGAAVCYSVEGVEELVVVARHRTAEDGEPPFASLKQHGKWPRSFSRNSDGIEQQVSDKSRPEGAVVFSHMDGQGGGLIVDWAVFLPLEEHSDKIRIQDSSRSFRITLHGQFFVDAGRKGIFGFDELFNLPDPIQDMSDEKALRTAWNRQLAEKVTLPLLLPTLESYCHASKLKDKNIEQLTKAIDAWIEQMKHPSVRNTICHARSWVRLLEPEGPKWQLVDAGQRLLPMPSPPDSEKKRPWEVFPVLDRFCLISAEATALSACNLQWQEQEMLDVIQSIDIKNAFTPTGLGYLADWLQLNEKGFMPFLCTEQVQAALVSKLRNGLRSFKLAQIGKIATPLKRVLRNLQPDLRVCIGTSDTSAQASLTDDCYAAMLAADTSQLLIPKNILNEESRPAKQDMLAWLQALQPMFSDRHAVDAMSVIDNLLDSLNGDLHQFLQENKQLKVIQARNVSAAKHEMLSWQQLSDLKHRHVLFADSQVKAPKQLGALAKVLREQPIYQLTNKRCQAVFGDKTKLTAADDNEAILACIYFYSGNFGGGDERKELISQTASSMAHGVRKEARLGMRYLLHGDSEKRDCDGKLWFSDSDTPDVWGKLLCVIQPIAKWQMISQEFTGSLSGDACQVLGMSRIDRNSVIKQLGEAEEEKIEAVGKVGLSEAGRNEILKHVDEKALWKSLPLHAMQDRTIGPISDDVYLQSEVDNLPKALVMGVRFIVPSADDKVRESQQKWVPALSSQELALRALKSEFPENYWHYILDAIQEPGSLLLQDDHVKTLKAVAWLPLENGKRIAPGKLLQIDGLEDDIRRLASRTEYKFAAPDDLSADVKEYADFQSVLSRLSPDGEQALRTVLQAMEHDSEYAIGKLPKIDNQLLEQALPALTQLKELPGWRLLASAAQVLKLDLQAVLARESERKDLPIARLVKVLNALVEHGNHNQAVSAAHWLYLSVLAKHPDCSNNTIAQLQLKASDGSWHSADELCADVAGIKPSSVLDRHYQPLLSGYIVMAGSPIEGKDNVLDPRLDTMQSAAPDLARSHFEKLRGLTKPQAIGAFLVILGARFRALAESYLHPLTFDSVCEKISGVDRDPRSEEANRILKSLKSESLKVGLQIERDLKLELNNILGQPRKFERDKSSREIVVGPPLNKGPKTFVIKLAPPEELLGISGVELSESLRNAVRRIIGSLHEAGSVCNRLDKVWQSFSSSSQLELATEEAMILDYLPIYLEQMSGLIEQPKNLKDKLNQIIREKRNSIESEGVSSSGYRARSENLHRKHLNELGEIVKNDSEVQRYLIQCVRHKLGDYQYSKESVLFELFQNADDAEQQLFDAADDPSSRDAGEQGMRRFVLESSAEHIRVLHWGRLINDPVRYGDTELQDKYRDDLRKMLILNASGKSGTRVTTGKFGLGFKSVYLVCDEPRFISGDLLVKIKGGMLPEQWQDGGDAARLLNGYTRDARERGTVFELPVPETKQREMLQPFERYIGLLPVFSRRIRQIELVVNAQRKVVGWNPDVLAEGVEAGDVALPEGKSGKVLLIRNDHGSVALRLAPDGCTTFDESISHIWVTVPTRETDNIGFIINADFRVDVGRGRLGGDEAQHNRLLDSIGRELGRQLAHLCMANAEPDAWRELRQKLGLQVDISAAHFWATLWDALAKHTIRQVGSDLAKMAATLVHAAFNAWHEVGARIPNGLKGGDADWHDADTPIGSMLQLESTWIERDILDCVLPILQLYPQGAPALVTQTIARLMQGTWSADGNRVPRMLRMAKLIEGICSESRCSSEQAELLGTLLGQLKAAEIKLDDTDARFAAKLLFKVEDGNWQRSTGLLCSANNPDASDERLRFDFAPSGNRLAGVYSPEAIEFFIACRSKMSAPAERLADWALAAADEGKRMAVLRYIANGELGRELAERIRGKGWLADNEVVSKLKAHLPMRESLIVYCWLISDSQLQQQPSSFPGAGQIPPVSHARPKLRGRAALEAIYDWWQNEGATHRKEYLKKLYPGGELTGLSQDSEEVNRTAWMTLFALAVFQRLGRTRAEQHRGFLEHMQSKGWWQIICEQHPEQHSDAWLNILKEFAESNEYGQEYDYWLDSFPRLYQLAYWLKEYVNLFEDIRSRNMHELNSSLFLKPVADPAMQGSGRTAPAIDRTMKIGVNLVVRELLRNKVIDNSAAYSLAFMPVKRVRKLFDEIDLCVDENCTSEDIWRHLQGELGIERATFGDDFDIPFLILAESDYLLEQVCGISISESSDSPDYREEFA